VLRQDKEDIVLGVPVYPIGRGFETTLEMLPEIRSVSFRDELLRYLSLLLLYPHTGTREGIKEAKFDAL
jgi:uncharacterized protein with NAD-binding domain and iron-sulfur cluster